jgi:hypothetical protein
MYSMHAFQINIIPYASGVSLGQNPNCLPIIPNPARHRSWGPIIGPASAFFGILRNQQHSHDPRIASSMLIQGGAICVQELLAYFKDTVTQQLLGDQGIQHLGVVELTSIRVVYLLTGLTHHVEPHSSHLQFNKRCYKLLGTHKYTSRCSHLPAR